MLLVSSVTFASDFNIDGKWPGVSQGSEMLTFEFKAEGKKLYGRTVYAADSKTEIRKGKIKKNKISFEVPVTSGISKYSEVYKGTIISDNEIELTFRRKTRGPRAKGFGERGGGDFDSGFGGGLGGFGGVSQESTKFIIKRVGDGESKSKRTIKGN